MINIVSMEHKEKLGPLLKVQISNLNEGSKTNSANRLKVFVQLKKGETAHELGMVQGVEIGQTSGQVITASIPLSRLDQVVSLEEVKYIELATRTCPENG